MNCLKSFDSYGVPITVNYRGNDSYKTAFGAILSIIAGIVVLAYAAVQSEQLVLRNGPFITNTIEEVDYATDTKKLDLAGSDLEAVI